MIDILEFNGVLSFIFGTQLETFLGEQNKLTEYLTI